MNGRIGCQGQSVSVRRCYNILKEALGRREFGVTISTGTCKPMLTGWLVRHLSDTARYMALVARALLG